MHWENRSEKDFSISWNLILPDKGSKMSFMHCVVTTDIPKPSYGHLKFTDTTSQESNVDTVKCAHVRANQGPVICQTYRSCLLLFEVSLCNNDSVYHTIHYSQMQAHPSMRCTFPLMQKCNNYSSFYVCMINKVRKPGQPWSHVGHWWHFIDIALVVVVANSHS